MFVQLLNDVCPKFTTGILTVVLASSLLFGVQEFCNVGLTEGLFSVGASVLENGHVHRLFLYPFHHKTGAQLLLSILAFVFLSSSLERGFGTVRFLIMFTLLSITSGLAYAILDLLQDHRHQTEGLLPTALSCIALTTMHTRMTKGFLCGVSFPTIALPWVFLITTTILIPNAVLPCNIVAIFTGWMYGRGWFSLVQMSEFRASVLEKHLPFRYLKAACHTTFVPASTEERKKIILPQVSCAPPAGSYPVQAYAPASSLHPHQSVAMPYDGWVSHNNALASGPVSLHPGQSHGHYNHSHNPSNLPTNDHK